MRWGIFSDIFGTFLLTITLEQVERAKETCSDPIVLVEQMLDLSRWIPESFGTADALVASDDTLTIVDMKLN